MLVVQQWPRPWTRDLLSYVLVNRLILYGHDNVQTMTAPTGNKSISREWGITIESEIFACYLNQLRQKKRKRNKQNKTKHCQNIMTVQDTFQKIT